MAAFVDPQHVDVARTQILRAAEDEPFAVVAYCFMPDHLHLLIEAGSESSNALNFIKRAKQLCGFTTRISLVSACGSGTDSSVS
jgi:REP element-mobilizing transposase RayT